MPTIVDILTMMSMMNFKLSLVKHEKCFIAMGRDPLNGKQHDQ